MRDGNGVEGEQSSRAAAVVVAAVDGSSNSDAALAWAGEEARRREATLVVTHAWHVPSLVNAAAVSFLSPPVPDFSFYRDHARRLIEQALARVLGPGRESLRVESRPVQGGDDAIVNVARGADLLVVGTSDRTGVTGALAGSTRRFCLIHASCPVVVVPGAAQRLSATAS